MDTPNTTYHGGATSANPILELASSPPTSVCSGDIEVELGQVGRAELGCLQLDDDVAVCRDVEHQQVDDELVVVEFQVPLAADEGEPMARLKEKPPSPQSGRRRESRPWQAPPVAGDPGRRSLHGTTGA